MAKIDFKQVAAQALNSLESLLDQWLPDGKRDGHEFKALNPTRGDSKPGSFSINLNSGAWADFATDDKGGDAISLLAYITGESQLDAAKDIMQQLGIALPDSSKKPPSKSSEKQEVKPKSDETKSRSEWSPIVPVPDNAAIVPVAHIKRGRPDASWTYRTAEGGLVGFIWRFTTSDGGKEILPLTYCQHAVTGTQEWRWMAFPEPRPLYVPGAWREGVTKLIVEGEKCADVAHALLDDYDAVSWPGGSKAVEKADWSRFVEGDKVLLWPDCDAQVDKHDVLLPEPRQPGIAAMEKIAQKLIAQGCKVRIVVIPKPGEKPSGWDIADAVDGGMNAETVREFIKTNQRSVAVRVKEEKSISTPSEAGANSEDDGEGWRFLLFRNDKLKLVDHRDNVFLILENHPEWRGKIARDSFANRIVLLEDCPVAKARILEEEHALRLSLWLAQQMSLIVKNLGSIVDGVRHVAFNHQFHPVRDWLKGLEWDGTERRFDWLTDFLGVRKCEYSMMSGSQFLIALVARAMEPGCIMRQMPILEGGQFAGKSTAMRILGGKWFGDTPIRIGDKDAYQVLPGKWIYEIAELDAFNRAESTAMKAFISSPTDTYRASYDRAAKDWPRQTVFVGTVNHEEYFKDSTGNTRYVPWRCEQDGQINLEGLALVRDQLFAEAYQRYLAKDHWWPSREEQKRLYDPQQAQREIVEIWVELLADGLDAITSPRVSMTDLINILKLDASKIDNAKSVSTRLGNCMKKLGWEIDRETAGSRKRYYVRPKSDVLPQKSVAVGGDDEPF